MPASSQSRLSRDKETAEGLFCSTQCVFPMSQPVSKGDSPVELSAKESTKSTGHSPILMPREYDMGKGIAPMNEVSQNARRELQMYEESFDSMRIWKRRTTLGNHEL